MCTVYGVLFSPLWLKFVPGCPAISVSTWQQFRLGQRVWFGWLSAISQLASRVGEGGGVGQICLQSVTLLGPGGESREGVCFPSPWSQCTLFCANPLFVRARRPHKSSCGRRQIPTVCAGQLQPGIQTYHFFCRAEFFPSALALFEFPFLLTPRDCQAISKRRAALFFKNSLGTEVYPLTLFYTPHG
jgi:hypothetical protein